MAAITRTQTSTGIRVCFPKNWLDQCDKIDAIKFVSGEEFPGKRKMIPNFIRRTPAWKQDHPLVHNMQVLGDQFWQDPLDPCYVAEIVTHTVERPGAKGKGKRTIDQEMVMWQHRLWCYKVKGGVWTKSTERPDPKVLSEIEREDEDPPTNT